MNKLKWYDWLYIPIRYPVFFLQATWLAIKVAWKETYGEKR